MKSLFNAVARMFKSDPNKIGRDGCTRLQQAILNGDLEKARDLVKAGADLNLRGDLIHPPLHLALNKDRHSIAAMLVEAGADTNLKNGEGLTPLHITARESQGYLMRLLLKFNADPNIKDNDGRVPLHVMATANSALIRLLVSYNADVNESDKNGDTPLHLYIRKQEIVETLLLHGANPTSKNARGVSPYQEVLEDDRLLKDGQLLHLLMQGGADLKETNSGGETILHRAARLELPGVFDRVLPGSDLSATDAHGNTVLHALTGNMNIHMMEQVLALAPKLLHEKNNNGRTPLNLMMQRVAETNKFIVNFNKVEAASMLMLRTGADINTRDDKGQMLLHYAVQHGLDHFAELLIAKKSKLNIRDNAGKAPLHYAIERKSVEMLDRLLDAGADPDMTDERGWTILDRLAEKSDRESPVVQRLIVAGGQYNKMLPLNPDQMRQKKSQASHLDKRPGNNTGLNL
jgi:ankyrin repeat protein